MLKILERKITLQLLVFYGLFVIPLLLGGAELYVFQRDALQQGAQQANSGLAESLAQNVQTYLQGATEEAMGLTRSLAAVRLDMAQLQSLIIVSKQTHPEINQYLVCDPFGKILFSYPPNTVDREQQASTCAQWHEFQNKSQPFILSSSMNRTTHTSIVSIMARITDEQDRLTGIMILNLSLQQLNEHLLTVQKQLGENGEVHIWLLAGNGMPLLSNVETSSDNNLLQKLPGLRGAFQGKTGNVSMSDGKHDWLYSYVPVNETGWTVVVSESADATFATVISFQHTLVIALVMLLAGASVFWFVMHGWVVAPLGRLAQAAAQIKPGQPMRVTENRLLTREKSRQDEIGRLVNAFSTMEEEIHTLFRRSDEQSYTRLQTLDALLRSMDEGVLLEDPAGRVMYANRRFIRLVGMTMQEVPQDAFQSSYMMERIEALIEKPEAYQEALRRAERGDGPLVIEFQVRGYYNQLGQIVPSRRDIRMRLFEVRDMEGQVIGRGKIIHDATRQNEAEQVKKNLLAIVSHELRTPLTAIKGYATSLLETDVELDETTQRDFLQQIVKEEDRMAELVTSLLEMSQLEAGTLKLTPGLCRLETLIKRVVETVKNGRPQIEISLPTEMPLLYIDQRRMEMVLRNLWENAQRYAGNEARVTISARYVQESEEGGVYISMADNGPGLPEAFLERIFDRFYQIDGGRERHSSGVGLGLAICRGFVEAHGGRIWAENRTDQVTGAIFHIWLPARLLHTPGASTHPFALEKAL